MVELARRAIRPASLLLGLALIAWLVHGVGARTVAAILLEAGAWMPLIILCDSGFFACEAMAHRAVLTTQRSIPWRVFARASFLYYCVLAIAPLGRAGAEVARAAAFSPWVGAGRAAAAAANVQGGVLLANAVISIPCWVAVSATVGSAHPLAWLLLGNGAMTLAGGTLTLLVLRRSRIGRWLGERVPALAGFGADVDEAVVASNEALIRAGLWCVAARSVQIGMYASLLAAIQAHVSLRGTLVALGIHLVGAGLGDFVPNQVGVLEGAYRVFADALGLAADPARAIAIALLARIAQISIATIGLPLYLGLRGAPPSNEGERAVAATSGSDGTALVASAEPAPVSSLSRAG